MRLFTLDVLRGLATLAVLMYHANLFFEIGFASSGFFGVDLFFIISGFIVHRTLEKHVRVTKLPISTFLVRRMLRLLVPTIGLFVVFTPIAFLGLYKESFDWLMSSYLPGLTGTTNYFLAAGLGDYMSPSGLNVPTLHLWSIATEAHFYLLFPFLFYFTQKLRASTRVKIFCAVLLASFLWANLMSAFIPSVSYFDSASRFWQFMVGVLASVLAVQRPLSTFEKKLILVTTVSLIAVLFALPQIGNLHPGLSSLPISFVAFILLTLSVESANPYLIRANFLAVVGRSSFSIYLWHYPIFVLIYQSSLDFGALDFVVSLILTACLSYVSYRFLELRAASSLQRKAVHILEAAVDRDTGKIKLLHKGAAFLSGLIFAVSLIGFLFLPSPQSELAEIEKRVEKLILDANCNIHAPDEQACNKVQKADRKVFVVGDSMVPGAIDILDQVIRNAKFSYSTKSGCPPLPPNRSPTGTFYSDRCLSDRLTRFEGIDFSQFDLLVISSGGRYTPADLANWVRYIRADYNYTGKVIFLGPYLRSQFYVSDYIDRYGSVSQGAENFRFSSNSVFALQNPESRTFNPSYFSRVGASDLLVIEPLAKLCPSLDNCTLTFEETFFAYDLHHWSSPFRAQIAIHYGPQIREFASAFWTAG